LGCSRMEWYVLLLSSGLVLVTEIVNSELEYLCNHITPEQHDAIRKIKDVSAAAPLVASLFALVVGGIIFIPKILLAWG